MNKHTLHYSLAEEPALAGLAYSTYVAMLRHPITGDVRAGEIIRQHDYAEDAPYAAYLQSPKTLIGHYTTLIECSYALEVAITKRYALSAF